MAKKKKRGRPKGSGGGPRKKNELAPENLQDAYEMSKHVKDEVAMVVSTMSFCGKKGEAIGVSGELKKMNLAKQVLTQIAKEIRALGPFMRDYTGALRDSKKAEAEGGKKKKKKDKKKKKGKGKKGKGKKGKKKKNRDDDDD